jgi:hypothetical protein
MIPRTQRATTATAWIAPGTALCFAMLTTWLTPRYEIWFGSAMPSFTRSYLDQYPMMIGVSAIALAALLVARQFPRFAERCALCKAVDLLLAVASLLIIAGGIIALFLPVLVRPSI